MKRLICAFFLQFLALVCFSAVPACADTTDGKFETYWAVPEITPPESHPKVFFTADKIPSIRENIDAEENPLEKTAFMKLVNKTLSYTESEAINYDETVLAGMEAKAFYYIMYKDTEEFGDKAFAIGEEVVGNIGIILNMDTLDAADKEAGVTEAQNSPRRYGRIMNVLSEIYDWCYPLLENDTVLRDAIIDKCISCVKNMEIWDSEKYSPNAMNFFSGHALEKENTRDLLSFAIAFSVERPDVWKAVGGRFYEEYVPAKEFNFESGYLHAGTDYGVVREYGTVCAYALITGMGAPEPWNGEDMARLGYAELYSRRPDGQHLYDGDIYTNTIPPFSYTANASRNSMQAYAAVASEEEAPYFKNEYFRKSFTFNNGKLSKGYYEDSPVLNFILNDTSIKAKPYTGLSLSRYFPSPAGVMIARTGWEDGIDSETVVAQFKVNEYFFRDHQHLDSGHFGIYYKGLLAADGGNYNWYGDKEHYMYTRKSIAHNTMLIYDPDEGTFGTSDSDFDFSNINDGGQRHVSINVTSVDSFKQTAKLSTVMAHEIDPQNTKKPYYTYLKGDLTNSYSDKVSDFKRSFMFLNLNDEEIPAAVIVFDKVTSSDKKYKKMWLLHGVNEPTVDAENQVSIFTNTDNGYNGQMVTKTLLPKSADFDVVGGTEEGWGVVRKWEYNDLGFLGGNVWNSSNFTDYGADSTADKTEANERNTYRLEVSPSKANTNDHFFNVILIGDEGQEISIDTPLYEATDFYGTKVKDRIVFFSGDGAEKNSFSYTLSGDGTYRYTICDMEAGKYTVTVGKSAQTVYVSEDGGVLSFTAPLGEISVQKEGIDYIEPQDMSNEVYGEVTYFSNGKSFEKPLESVGVKADVISFAKGLGYSVTISEAYRQKSIAIYKGMERVTLIKDGEEKILTSRGTYTAGEAPQIDDDGSCIMSFADIFKILPSHSTYINYANTIYSHLSSLKGSVYAGGNITEDGKINLNVKVVNALECEILGAVKKDNILVAVENLDDAGNGCYSGSIDISEYNSEEYEIVVYAWGRDFYPFVPVKISTVSKNLKDFCTTDGNNQFRVGQRNQNCKIENAKFIVTRPAGYTAGNQTSCSFGSDSITSATEGIVHYSTTLRGNYFSNNSEQLATVIRGTGGTVDTTFRHRQVTYPGVEYKMDCIVDLDSDMVYIYEDGICVKSYLCDWTNVRGFEVYITNTEYETDNGEAQYELFDSTVRIYPKGTDLGKVTDTIGKFTILK